MINEKNYNRMLKIFLCIYPIFSLIFLYNSYFTLIQIAIILFFFTLLLVTNKNSRSKLKYLLAYFLAVVIYSLLHHLNALNFTSLVPSNFDYNLLKELLSIFKMSIPVLFLYIIYYSKLKKKDYLDIFKTWLLFICISIIATNLLKISLNSYTMETIKGNIFSWFTTDLTNKETASIAFFKYPNQISCLLTSIIPLLVYYYYKNKLNVFYLVILLLSELMIATRVATIGGFLVFFGMNILYLIYIKLSKQHLNLKKILPSIALIIIYLAIFPFSPAYNRHQNNYLKSPLLLATTTNPKISDLDYIEKTYKDKGINEEFIIRSYPYQYDPEFWLKILNEKDSDRTDYRHLEISMIKRIKEINNNPFDTVLGLTNTRVLNVFNIEKDYVMQYYSYGLLGILIFLSIYIFLFVISLINLLKNITFLNLSIFLTNALIIAIPFMSGNIFASISIFIPLIFIMTMTLKNKKKNTSKTLKRDMDIESK